VAQRRYYNVVAKAVVEDLLLRLYEQRKRKARSDHGARSATDGNGNGNGAGSATNGNEHGHVVEGPRPGRIALGIAHVLTWFLKLDVVLFGGIRTGPFFGLLRPAGPRSDPSGSRRK